MGNSHGLRLKKGDKLDKLRGDINASIEKLENLKFGGVTLLLNHSRGLSSSSDIIIPDYPSHPVSSVSLLASFGSLFAFMLIHKRW